MSTVYFYTENETESFSIESSDLDTFGSNLRDVMVHSNIRFEECVVTIELGDTSCTFFPFETTFIEQDEQGNLSLKLNNKKLSTFPYNIEENPYNIRIRRRDAESFQHPIIATTFSTTVMDIKIFKKYSNDEEYSPGVPIRIKVVDCRDKVPFAPKQVSQEPQKEPRVFLKMPNDDLVRVICIDETRIIYRATDGSDVTMRMKAYHEFFIDIPTPRPIRELEASIDHFSLRNSFKAHLTSKGSRQLEIISSYFIKSLDVFRNDNFYAPIAPVCQSSGYGKTRLILETGSRFPLIYSVFRAATDRSYPEQPKWVNLFYKSITSSSYDDFYSENFICSKCNVGNAILFILSMLRAFKNWFLQLVGRSSDGGVYEGALTYLRDAFTAKEGHEQFLNFLVEAMNDGRAEYAEMTTHRAVDLVKEITVYFSDVSRQVHRHRNLPNSNAAHFPFLLVLDEVANLLEIKSTTVLNPLYIIRRALHHLRIDGNLLVVFIGTNSDISRFHRSVTDNSIRFKNRTFLLEPLVLSCNFDIFQDQFDLGSIIVNRRTACNRKLALFLATLGRPLWASLPLNSVFSIASLKIVNGCSEFVFAPSMAIWAIRTGLTVNADLKLARTLLNSHMATLMHLPIDTEYVYVTYPSEPVLAIACRLLLQTDPNLSIERILLSLLEYVQARPIDRGRIVESVFDQFILLAVDKADNLALDFYRPDDLENDRFLRNLFTCRDFIFEKSEQRASRFPNWTNGPETTAIADTGAGVSTPEVSEPATSDDDSTSDASTAAPDVAVPDVPIDLSTDLFYSRYHVTSVESFLSKLYGAERFESMRMSIPDTMLRGLVNCSHFVQLRRQFPIGSVYSEETPLPGYLELPNAGSAKGCNIIDRSLLRNGFIRQAGFVMPPGYYGYDSIIPVLLERDAAEVQGNAVFSFIGIQIKKTAEDIAIVMEKMRIDQHYVKSTGKANGPTDSKADLDLIFHNHLTLYICASGSLGMEVQSQISRVSNRTTSNTPKRLRLHSTDKFVITRLYSQVFSQICIFTQDLAVFTSLIGERALEMASLIIQADNNPIDLAENHKRRLVADCVLSNQFCMYPNADKYLRDYRGLDPIQNDPQNLINWTPNEILLYMKNLSRKHAKIEKHLAS